MSHQKIEKNFFQKFPSSAIDTQVYPKHVEKKFHHNRMKRYFQDCSNNWFIWLTYQYHGIRLLVLNKCAIQNLQSNRTK